MIKRILSYIKSLFGPKVNLPPELSERELQIISDKRELDSWISKIDMYRNNLNASLNYELRNQIGKMSNDLLIKQLRYNIKEAEGIIYQLKNNQTINRDLLPKEQVDTELSYVKPKKPLRFDRNGSLFNDLTKPSYTPKDILSPNPTSITTKEKPSTIKNMLYFKN